MALYLLHLGLTVILVFYSRLWQTCARAPQYFGNDTPFFIVSLAWAGQASHAHGWHPQTDGVDNCNAGQSPPYVREWNLLRLFHQGALSWSWRPNKASGTWDSLEIWEYIQSPKRWPGSYQKGEDSQFADIQTTCARRLSRTDTNIQYHGFIFHATGKLFRFTYIYVLHVFPLGRTWALCWQKSIFLHQPKDIHSTTCLDWTASDTHPSHLIQVGWFASRAEGKPPRKPGRSPPHRLHSKLSRGLLDVCQGKLGWPSN